MVTQDMLRTYKGKNIFFAEKNRFVTALEINKCLKQIKYQRSLHTCTPLSELPSNISTMIYLH